MRANALAVMAKAPLPGEAKTRLMPALNANEAAELARALLLDQLAHLSAISDADLYLAFTPAAERPLFEDLAAPEFQLFPQAGDDLGARMANLFAHLFARGYKNIALVGADLPPVPLAVFAEAFVWLDKPGNHAVLGPSRDGGYYLIGMNQPLPAIFAGIRWSQSDVLARTVEKAAELKIAVRLLPTWFDVDTPEDLEYLIAHLDPDMRAALKNTARFLDNRGVLNHGAAK